MIDTKPDEAELSRSAAAAWGWPLVMSLAVMALGVFAIVAAGIASLATVLTFGLLLIAGGVAEVIFSLRNRRRGATVLPFLNGLLSVVIGFFFLRRPIFGLSAATLLLAAYFFASGLFRGLTSLMDRYPHWGWDFFNGLVSIALGVLVLATFPVSALWILGVFVGVELLVRGAALLGASLAVRRAVRGTAAA